ncbi:hypothetical protein ACFW4M_30265 [Streptomyces sp. NPDC058794]|uniref:hypothetical protein n=1 Tax=unclassified Streptomyces TaxID=2593676 RepID=UPI0036A9A383
MPQNAGPIHFTRISDSGRRVDAHILPGFAEVHESGIVLSFVLMDTGSLFGEAFYLDERANANEERIRKLGTWVGAHLAALQEGKFYQERTGEQFNPYAMAALTQLNRKLISWVDDHLPRLTATEVGYFDIQGRLRFTGMLHDASQM